MLNHDITEAYCQHSTNNKKITYKQRTFSWTNNDIEFLINYL